MLMRNLTPSTGPRIEVIADEQIGVRRYGTYAHASRPQTFTVAPSASMAMANRAPAIPETQQLDLPTQGKAHGLRIYDRRIDAYVAPPRPPIPVEMRAPQPTMVPYSESGPAYWVMDRTTGARMHRFCAQTPARAQQIANDYAINNGGSHGDAYAMPEK